MLKISIIILNWNGLKDTIECLESVKKIDYSNFDIIVVDNGSSDGSPEEIKKLFPEIIFLQNNKNLGFAEGNNVGIRYALKNGTDYIFLLNNDTIVDTQILKVFIEVANSYPEAGIFGAKIYYYSESNKIWFEGGKFDNEIMRFVTRKLDEKDFNRIIEVDYACGCALFFKSKVVENIGLFDPDFFLTFEETDWCYRARRKRFKTLIVPDARVWHKISVSFGGDGSPLYRYFFTRNQLLWAKKNLPLRKRYHLYYSIFKEFFPCVFTSKEASLIKRVYYDILKNIQDYKKPIFKAQIFGIRDFILRRFGNCPENIRYLNNL